VVNSFHNFAIRKAYMKTVFFTDGVLASSRSSASGFLLEYIVLPENGLVLESLRTRDARMGLIVHLRNQPQEALREALEKSGLLTFFDPQLVIFTNGLTELTLSSAREKALSESAVFVGEHCSERDQALKVGFQDAIPHPLLVSEVLSGGKLAYVRASQLNRVTKGSTALQEWPVVPFYVSLVRGGSAFLITSTRMVDKIGDLGLKVKVFGDEHNPQVTDPYIALDDRPVPKEVDRETFTTDLLKRENKAGLVVSPVEGGVLLALPPNVSIEDIHFPNGRHGHNRRLVADTGLLTAFLEEPSSRTDAVPEVQAALTQPEITVLRNIIRGCRIKELHDPYVGKTNLYKSTTKISSRHVSHKHNEEVTAALCQHLKDIGGKFMTEPTRVDFDLGNKILSNIEAELPGTDASSCVIISAHFDSTARYDGTTDPAPGGDDDASGVAALLAAAEAAGQLWTLGTFTHGLRFVLFNAEEDRIHGSQQYAKLQLAQKKRIRGVFQMDMIGYSGGLLQPYFQVHTGYAPKAGPEARSYPLRSIIAGVTSRVSSLHPPQFYPNSAGGLDPVFGRSDHTSFHARGYAACMISEDANEGPGDNSPKPRPNPDYHKKTDLDIDYNYAAEIGRVVAAAAIVAAKK
jgi:leucyl aminopeptidase